MKGEELRIPDSNAGAANGSGRDQIADDGVIGAYTPNNPYNMDTSPQNNEMMHQAANKSVSKTTSKPKHKTTYGSMGETSESKALWSNGLSHELTDQLVSSYSIDDDEYSPLS